MKTAIVTDSNSGITQEEARLSGVFVVPMPVLIDSKQYFEGVTLSQEQFYQKLRDGKVNVSTSQPNPFDVEELWTEILKPTTHWCTYPCQAVCRKRAPPSPISRMKNSTKEFSLRTTKGFRLRKSKASGTQSKWSPREKARKKFAAVSLRQGRSRAFT